jgi:hypothetical protein
MNDLTAALSPGARKYNQLEKHRHVDPPDKQKDIAYFPVLQTFHGYRENQQNMPLMELLFLHIFCLNMLGNGLCISTII